jgi:AraC-like DNA-binding protein
MVVFFEKIGLAAGQSFRLLKWSDNVRQVELCLGKGDTDSITGAGEQWHFHPEMELTLIIAGAGIRFIGDHIESFQAPDLVLIGTNLPHYWSDLHNSSGYAIQFSAEKTNPLWQLKEIGELSKLCKLASSGIHYKKTIARSLINKFVLMEQCSPAKQLGLFIEILDSLCNCEESERNSLSEKDFSISVAAQHLDGISDSILYLLNRFDQDVSFDDLLKISHMSKSTFCRQFKRHTGKTYNKFLNELRIDHSCRLLVETVEPVTNVAYQSGFRNLSQFNRKFLEHCGVTPKAYRAEFKNRIIEDCR